MRAPRFWGRAEPICRVAYEFCLLLAVLSMVVVLTLRWNTRYFNVDATNDSTHVSATVTTPERFSIGEHFSAYRFNPDWQEPIGKVEVAGRIENSITFKFDPSSFRWPMGRQGRVIGVENNVYTINLGSNLGLVKGNRLNLFDERLRVGQLEVIDPQPDESRAVLVSYRTPSAVPQSLLGLTVGEFEIANQITVEQITGLPAVEGGLVIAILLGYCGLWIRLKSSPLEAVGPKLLARFPRHPLTTKIFQSLLGIPIAWFGSEFLARSSFYFIRILSENLAHAPLNLNIPSWPLALVVLGIYEGLLWSGKSPIKAAGAWIAFKGGLFRREAREMPEHLTMWLFHLVIVYAFGRTLGAFLQENASQGLSASWPKAPPVKLSGVEPVSLDGFARTIHSTAYALTNAPHPANFADGFLTFQTAVYNLCILGCLLGYGYSLCSWIWGKKIRNIDFTLIGWASNAVCYGPLLGVVLWQMLPPAMGREPTVTNESIVVLMLLVAGLLNVAYTLSIWNLGTMFGVMTDMGVRTTGFYAVVRHPSYTLESLMFVVLMFRGLSNPAQWFAVMGYLVIYWLRSEREDQFMTASNPEYTSYKENVRYKFIPGIY